MLGMSSKWTVWNRLLPIRILKHFQMKADNKYTTAIANQYGVHTLVLSSINSRKISSISK